MGGFSSGDARDLFIGGTWRASRGGQTLPVVNPATEEVVASIADADASDVHDAVQAAWAAFDAGSWSRASGDARADVLERMAALVRRDKDRLARMETTDCGKP
eukprot:CAMPEP_0198244742 /NCGR_PEP_ID=MMETSP1446-20131203/37358_1 /TAXON_ID=1461542 ORGANISM="Unidentified sp, Strain CCMP2111" /NCGR_SAMPLE_ID=MMETSP1446 /ASSEMBLY_ACC=CAM_ASM_001112 /LENGTH=102 /DNA_ID=CAMNT_0043928839 /DNA_START=49 /DNA_END=353 /DNA_ORIENTATION=-